MKFRIELDDAEREALTSLLQAQADAKKLIAEFKKKQQEPLLTKEGNEALGRLRELLNSFEDG